MMKIGLAEIKALYKPPWASHKGENGVLLIIGGAKKYHGAPILAGKIASRIVDLVYFASTPENNKLIQKMKGQLAEFITVSRRELKEYVKKSDCILIGPGLGTTLKTKKLVNNLLKKFPLKKFVLDADALKVAVPKFLNVNTLVTPHAKEFEILFKKKATPRAVQEMAKKYQTLILLKGARDFICRPQECKYNETGNAGMTKGGTGDVLAGLVSALTCKNDLFLAACAGAYLNGLAADRLRKKVSYYFSASDLAEEIPRTLKWLRKN